MIYIETHSTDAAINFACEEFCMKKFKNHPKVMLIWQADNYAMLGKYQIPREELKYQNITKYKTKVIRRNTGGGTIYTDLGTLLYSFILPITDISEVDFSLVLKPIVKALNKLGVPAELKGRNDILIGEKKISGNAQAIYNSVLCSHGSLLYNTDLNRMQDLLQVDNTKIKSKGISSIKSRVTNIIDYLSQAYSIEEFWNKFKEIIFEDEEVFFYEFTNNDTKIIENIANNKYKSWEWNYGQVPNFNYVNEIRFSKGKIKVALNIENSIITECKINGDFLGLLPIESLEKLIIGNHYCYEEVKNKLEDLNLNMYLRGISKNELLKCLFE